MVKYEVGDKVVLADPEYDLVWFDENTEFKYRVLTVREVYGAEDMESSNLRFVGFSNDLEDILLSDVVRHATQEEIEAGHPIY